MSNRRLELKDVGTFKVTEVPIPRSPDGGAVVKVHYAGICHSDVHISQGMTHPKFKYPRVLGHEISGTIHSISESASLKYPDLAVNTRVVVFPWGNCHNCDFCSHDDPACENMILPTGKPGPIESFVYGVHRDGGYQQYMVVDHAEFLVRLPDNIPLDEASVVPCSGITALNAVQSLETSILKAIKYKGKAIVGVVGTGGLALWAIQLIKVLYPPSITVVAVDINEEKLTDAAAWGADVTCLWGVHDKTRDAAGALCRAAGGFLDGAIDFIGAESVIERVYMALNVGATLCLVGLAGLKLPPLLLPSMMYKNVTIKAHIVGSLSHCHQVLQLLKEGKIKTPPLAAVQLTEVQQTIALLKAGKQRGRAVVKL